MHLLYNKIHLHHKCIIDPYKFDSYLKYIHKNNSARFVFLLNLTHFDKELIMHSLNCAKCCSFQENGAVLIYKSSEVIKFNLITCCSGSAIFFDENFIDTFKIQKKISNDFHFFFKYSVIQSFSCCTTKRFFIIIDNLNKNNFENWNACCFKTYKHVNNCINSQQS